MLLSTAVLICYQEYLGKKKITPREFEKALIESGEMLSKSARKHLETGWKATTTIEGARVYLFKSSFLDVESNSDY